MWKLEFLDDVEKDLKSLDGHQTKRVFKALEKVLKNPLPNYEGGYGKPLESNLHGLLKIKLKMTD